MTATRKTIGIQGWHPAGPKDHGTITVIRTARPDHDADDIIYATYTYDHDHYWRRYHAINSAGHHSPGYDEHFTTIGFVVARTRDEN